MCDGADIQKVTQHRQLTAYYIPWSQMFAIDIACYLLVILLLSYSLSVQHRPVKIITFISEISMEIYLSHNVMFRVVEKLHLSNMIGNGWAQYILTPVCLVLVGAICFSYVVQTMINRIIRHTRVVKIDKRNTRGRKVKVQHVFLIGAKSLGAYGGYETFINKLTEYHQNNKNIKYHVAVKKNGTGAKIPDGAEIRAGGYNYHNADCFEIAIPEWLKSAQAIYYDCAALGRSIEIIKEQRIEHPIVYIMTCRIGPFFTYYARKIHALGGKVYLNPDGHEWMRAKWSAPVKKYWKYSEKKMIMGSDLIVCDSVNIEKYVQKTYGVQNTTFIAYGAETRCSKCPEEKYEEWLKNKDLRRNEYYLIVGRFVPENNYETMIEEYMKSSTKKDFAIITNDNPGFLEDLNKKLGFKSDKRIKFVGTVYDQELLKKIREEAYGYFHGHEVGGTNPSLLEALGSTKLNLLLDVGFNREVAEDAALYWTKEDGSLSGLINKCEGMDREKLGRKARERIKTAYSWEYISSRYAEIWCD